jgi:hypothetical protein
MPFPHAVSRTAPVRVAAARTANLENLRIVTPALYISNDYKTQTHMKCFNLLLLDGMLYLGNVHK